VDEVVVIGGGGHAKVLISVLKKAGRGIVGYTAPLDQGPILGVQYLGSDSILAELLMVRGHCGAILGVGKIDSSQARTQLQERIGALGFEFPVVVSPSAVVNEEVALGPGTVVFDGVVVNPGTTIGRLCILNTHSTIEHDCRLGDNVHAAPGATLGGEVVVGDNCMIGAGATVVQGVAICTGCLIGAGSTVIADITSPGTYAGNPVKRIR